METTISSSHKEREREGEKGGGDFWLHLSSKLHPVHLNETQQLFPPLYYKNKNKTKIKNTNEKLALALLKWGSRGQRRSCSPPLVAGTLIWRLAQRISFSFSKQHRNAPLARSKHLASTKSEKLFHNVLSQTFFFQPSHLLC